MKIFSRCFLMIEFPPAKNPIPLYVAGKNSNMDSAMINTGNKEDRGCFRVFDSRGKEW